MRNAPAEPAESLVSHAEGGRERPDASAPAPGVSRALSGLNASTVLSLQRTAGNAVVCALLRAPSPSAPPAQAIGADPAERRYDFEATVYGKPVHYRNLTPQDVVAKLRQLWRFCHDELDEGRGENLRLAELGREHRTAAFWSNVAGGTSLPDPAMWNEVGAGTLSELRAVLDSTDAALKAGWERDRNLPPEVARLPIMQAAAAFDATSERIKQATALLDRAAAELAERQRRLDDFVGRTTKGAARMITGIKVEIVLLTVVAGGQGAAFAGEGAGLFAQAAAGAGTAGVLGVSGEFFTQVGEMRIGEREHFDVARIAKRGAKDVVIAFVGGVIGGQFAKVLGNRIGGWVSGLSDEALAAQGLAREAFLTNGQRLFIEWVGGAVASSPFTTTAGVLMDRALEGKWQVHTFGEFADHVIDDMIVSGAMGGFLIYGGHAMSRSAPQVTTSPAAGARTSPSAAAPKSRPATKSTRRPTPAELEAPVIEESPPGGFEPTTREPPVEDPGPDPIQEDIDPEQIGEVESDGVPDPIHDEPATAPHEPVPDKAVTASRPALGLGTPPSGSRGPVSEDLGSAARDRRRARPYNYRPPRGAPPAPSAPGRKPATPTPETRVKADPERKFHPSLKELRLHLAEALKKARAEHDLARPQGAATEFDALIAEVRQVDPVFARKAVRYFKAMEDPGFLLKQMTYLWRQARDHGRTVAEELLQRLGGAKHGVNDFKNAPGLDEEAKFAEFLEAVKDPRVLNDLSNSGDYHGSLTHAFHQYLGDQLFGPGEGLKFRQRLAELKGTSKTVRPGEPGEYEQPFWSRIWDEMFDSYGNLHSPEMLGRLLQQHLDFPRYD